MNDLERGVLAEFEIPGYEDRKAMLVAFGNSGYPVSVVALFAWHRDRQGGGKKDG